MITDYGMDSTTPFALCKRMQHGVLAALNHLTRQGGKLGLEFTFDPKKFWLLD
ncbi:hypothetical protein ACH4U5_09570 [Streptomyces sp. NPDC020858]|uniref:hypothetical protein n=1 Tax=Streptomyces sp. NPDC020858 TaxID=3365097 RepID=UPI00378D41A2